jgi:kinesin family member 5
MSNVRVVCRTRPLNRAETERGGYNILDYSSDYGTIQIINPSDARMKHSFNFDRCFPPGTSQSIVYDFVAEPILEDIFRGYNGTLFVYGQTGSGKTHTMMGPDGGKGMEDFEMKGIVPRIVKNIFDAVEQSDENLEFLVKVSFLEIYMERIRDLLNITKDNLRVREDKGKGVWVEGATEVYCSCEDDVMNVLRLGQIHRSVAATKMNAESSRSHSIFLVTITQKNIKSGSSKSGTLYLVDLAGSEKVGKTGAEGQTLEEAKMINKSLTALGQVINALTDPKSKHVPYRDSKLTRLLQNSLGGNSRTTLCINCSPSDYNYGETLSTLRFGQRAKSIKNNAKVNQERSVAELMGLLVEVEKEIALLKTYIEILIKELLLLAPGHHIPPMSAAQTEKSQEEENEDRISKGDEGDDTGEMKESHYDDQTSPSTIETELPEESLHDLDASDTSSSSLFTLIESDLEMKMKMKSELLTKELEERVEELKVMIGKVGTLRDELVQAHEVEKDFAIQNKLLQEKMTDLGVWKESQEYEVAQKAIAIEELTSQKQVLQNEITELTKQIAVAEENLVQQEKELKEYEETPEPSTESSDHPTIERKTNTNTSSSRLSRAAINDLVDAISSLRKENESLMAEKQSLEALVSTHQFTIIAQEIEKSTVTTMMPIDPTKMDFQTALTKYNTLEAQHRSLRKLTAQKFKEFDSLKTALLRDLQNRCEKVIDLEVLLDEAKEQYQTVQIRSTSKTKNEKQLILLERNLENLTQAHHKEITLNQKLRADLEAAEKTVEMKDKRIVQLEQKLTAQQRESQVRIQDLREQIKDLRSNIELIKKKTQTDPPHAVGNSRIAKPIRGGGKNIEGEKKSTGIFGFLKRNSTTSISTSAPNVSSQE